MKKLIYIYFINDRYAKTEKSLHHYDYVGCFLDAFGTSKALRMNPFIPKNDSDRQKLDQMYEEALKHAEAFSNEPTTFLMICKDIVYHFIYIFNKTIWFTKCMAERIFQKN